MTHFDFKRSTRTKQYDRERNRRIKVIVIEYYSNGTMKCACCGESHLEFMTIEHNKGNGKQHRLQKGVGKGSNFYIWLIKNNFPEGFSVLCWNCNSCKGLYGYCPHELEYDGNVR